MEISSKLLIKVALGAALVVVILFVKVSTPYVPNVALADAASGSANADGARKAMFGILEKCLPIRHLEPDDIGRKLWGIHSLENDAGFLATTRFRCDDRQCTVEATALIPAKIEPDVCRRRHGRRRGFAGYFSKGD